jgi:hypothetical protein
MIIEIIIYMVRAKLAAWNAGLGQYLRCAVPHSAHIDPLAGMVSRRFGNYGARGVFVQARACSWFPPKLFGSDVADWTQAYARADSYRPGFL